MQTHQLIIPSRVTVEGGRLWRTYIQEPMAGESWSRAVHTPKQPRKDLLDRSFFDEIDSYIREIGGGCPCKLTSAFLAAIGAEFSSKMHLDPGRTWSEEEYIVHFAEEDDHVVPLMRALGFKSDANEIEVDHDRFRRQKERGIPFDWQEIARHAAREEKMIARLRSKMEAMVVMGETSDDA